MISGAVTRPAPAVAPSATAPSLSVQLHPGAIHSNVPSGELAAISSGDLFQEGGFTAKGTDDRELQRLAEQLAGDPPDLIRSHRVDCRHGFVDVQDRKSTRLNSSHANI